jgi:hypothetical protein
VVLRDARGIIAGVIAECEIPLDGMIPVPVGDTRSDRSGMAYQERKWHKLVIPVVQSSSSSSSGLRGFGKHKKKKSVDHTYGGHLTSTGPGALVAELLLTVTLVGPASGGSLGLTNTQLEVETQQGKGKGTGKSSAFIPVKTPKHSSSSSTSGGGGSGVGLDLDSLVEQGGTTDYSQTFLDGGKRQECSICICHKINCLTI